MTDLNLSGPADEGHDHTPPPHFSTAEDVNPPQPGEPGYDDYARRRSEWLQGIEHQGAEAPGVEVRPTPYFRGGLGRTIGAGDRVPMADKPGANRRGYGLLRTGRPADGEAAADAAPARGPAGVHPGRVRGGRRL